MTNLSLNLALFQSLPPYHNSKGKIEKLSRSCPACHSGKLAFGRQGEYFVNICGCSYSDIYAAGRKFLGGDFDTSEYKEKQEQKRLDQARIRAEKLQGKLSPDQLDKSIRALAGSYGLRKNHQEKLIERGFTPDQIKEKLFFSISKGENDLPPGVPANFPGVNQRGKLYSSYNGIACIYFSVEGKALSWQVRNDDHSIDNDSPKYPWLPDSKVKVSNDQDELPINVFLPPAPVEIKNNTAIGLEGSLKGNLAGYRFNIPVLSASSGLFSGSPILVKQAIEKLGISNIILFVDGGDCHNDHRRLHWQNQVKFFENIGVTVSIGWYQQWEKSGLDLDEIAPDQLFPKIELLTLKEWLGLDYIHWKLGEIRKTYRELTGAKIINPDQKYLDLSSEYHAIKAARLFALKAPMGSGKTEQNLQIATGKYDNSLPPLLINLTYLNSLSRGLQGRSGGYFKHLQDYDIIPGNSNLSFCHQSLPKFLHDREELKGRRVFIDEIVSVVESILNGKNVQKRFLIFELLRELLQQAEKVIITDANLSDTEINFIKILMGIDNDQVLILEKPASDNSIFNIIIRDTWYLEPNGSGNNCGKDSVGKLINEINFFMGIDKKNVVTSESQKDLETIHNIASAMYPNKKIIRIDSTTVRNADPQIEQLTELFLKYPDQTIEQEQPDLLLISPLCSSGTDISIKNYFFRHYHLSRGVLNINANSQLLGRLRDLMVEKHLFFLRPDIEKYYPNIDDIFHNDARAEVIRRETLKGRISDALAVFSDTDQEIMEHQKHIDQQTQSLIDKYSQEYRLARQLQTLTEYEKANQRALLVETLREKGHNIIEQENLIQKGTDKNFQEEKENIKKRDSKDIWEADYIPLDIPADQLPNIDQVAFINKEHRTPQKPDSVGLLNHSYRKRLPGIEKSKSWTADLVYTLHFGDKSLIDKLSLYHLIQNPDRARNLKQSKTISYLNNSPDFIENYDKYSPMIDTLHYLGIDKLINRTTPYSGNDDQIKEICLLYKNKKNSKSKQARELLGINPDRITSNCQLVAAILGKIQVGTRGKKLEKEINGKTVTWTEYSVILPEAPRYKKLTKKEKAEGVQPELIPSPIPDLLAAINIKFDRYSPEKFNQEQTAPAPAPNTAPITSIPTDNAINPIPDISPAPAPAIAPAVNVAPAVASEGEKVQVAIAPRDGHNTSFNPAPAPITPAGTIAEKLNQLKPGDFVRFADGWDDLKYQIISISSKGVAKVKGLYGSCLNPTIDALIPC